MSSGSKSLEQWARELLELAIDEGLVRLAPAKDWGGDPHPHARSAGELVAVANQLNSLVVSHDARWHPGELHSQHRREGTWRGDGVTIQFDMQARDGSPYVGAPVLANEQGLLERCAPDNPARIGWLARIEPDMSCVVLLA